MDVPRFLVGRDSSMDALDRIVWCTPDDRFPHFRPSDAYAGRCPGLDILPHDVNIFPCIVYRFSPRPLSCLRDLLTVYDGLSLKSFPRWYLLKRCGKPDTLHAASLGASTHPSREVVV